MTISAEGLLIILLVGAIAGWIAGLIVKGTGFGLVADIALGIVGAFIGSWLLPKLGVRIGTGLAAQIIVAVIGALVLLLILGLFARGGVARGPGRGLSLGLVLTPPSYIIFLISIILAVVALLMTYAGVRIPISGLRAFDLLAIAYVVLTVGVLFRGL
jgi:uncharacterized membrane protein YeaQ/YmgE (transglycosylase-associated protein family)